MMRLPCFQGPDHNNPSHTHTKSSSNLNPSQRSCVMPLQNPHAVHHPLRQHKKSEFGFPNKQEQQQQQRRRASGGGGEGGEGGEGRVKRREGSIILNIPPR